ncbi:SAM-dependent methyltransferase [Streptacidiphilus melanogenes]|uniref:SAM-dependent methyltransferase n=1 Tax=Streptacidiphilus melanogenes TaxID=411235 RepID=UPI0009FEDC3C
MCHVPPRYGQLTWDDEREGEVRTLLDAVPSGSPLVLSHATADASPNQVGRAGSACRGGVGIRPRTREGFARLAEGLALVGPGIVPPAAWRSEPNARVLGAAGGEPTPVGVLVHDLASAHRVAPRRYPARGGPMGSGHGSFHCWLAVSAQSQIWTWVPEPP